MFNIENEIKVENLAKSTEGCQRLSNFVANAAKVVFLFSSSLLISCKSGLVSSTCSKTAAHAGVRISAHS